MQLVRVRVRNFRGIAYGEAHLKGHTVLVGDNNVGKSTLLEAVDLVLGPERLNRRPVVDEHDFHAGTYVNPQKSELVSIQIEVVVSELTEEQQRHFRDHIEWWDTNTKTLIVGQPPEKTDLPHVSAAIRVFFNGWYDVAEDDFAGDTYYANPQAPDGTFVRFSASDKRKCGFLYLRTLRTGSRALSLERGSLLDVILRLKDTRLTMWEGLLGQLKGLPVGEGKEIGELLASVQRAVRQYVPSDWAQEPHMRVSDLTRDMLRRTLTVFMGTGATQLDGSAYAAPYQHQGTGTINTLVLSLLSIIAELKQSVIFAMEEPEIALPPHTQKRIINSLRQKSAQAIFTSHSPYVLEEFDPEQVLVLKRSGGMMTGTPAAYPPAVKPKAYRTEFRTRFCEALLARYVLVLEGKTEFDALPAAARRLCELDAARFKSFENLGVAIVDARGDTNVAPLGAFFKSLGKVVFAVFDKQSSEALKAIVDAVDHAYESATKGFESLVLNGTSEGALRSYALAVVSGGDWPPHLAHLTPTTLTPLNELKAMLSQYFNWAKGDGNAGDLLASCPTVNEMPEYVLKTLEAIKNVVEPSPPSMLPLPPQEQMLVKQEAGPVSAVDCVGEEPLVTAVPSLPSYGKFVPQPPTPLV